MLTPIQSRKYARLVNEFNEKEFYAYYNHLGEGGTVEDFFDKVEKHGDHDQSDHGSWATGVGSYDDMELQAETMQKDYWDKKRELQKYMDSKGIENPSWDDIQNDSKAKKLDAEATAVWEKSSKIVNKFYEEHLGHRQLQTNEFQALRDKYVVADTPTLKMNRELREGGGLTQRVKDADKMCATGAVTKDLGVYRGAVLPKEMLDNLKVGKTFIDKGFQSTDFRKISAKEYAEIRKDDDKIKGELTLFRMTLKKGLNAVDVGYGEVVVQRNANLTVTRKTKSGKYTIVDVEVSK